MTSCFATSSRSPTNVEKRNPGVGSVRAAAAHVRGLAQRSAADLEQAAKLFGETGRPIAQAAALEDLGLPAAR